MLFCFATTDADVSFLSTAVLVGKWWAHPQSVSLTLRVGDRCLERRHHTTHSQSALRATSKYNLMFTQTLTFQLPLNKLSTLLRNRLCLYHYLLPPNESNALHWTYLLQFHSSFADFLIYSSLFYLKMPPEKSNLIYFVYDLFYLLSLRETMQLVLDVTYSLWLSDQNLGFPKCLFSSIYEKQPCDYLDQDTVLKHWFYYIHIMFFKSSTIRFECSMWYN